MPRVLPLLVNTVGTLAMSPQVFVPETLLQRGSWWGLGKSKHGFECGPTQIVRRCLGAIFFKSSSAVVSVSVLRVRPQTILPGWPAEAQSLDPSV